jgi:hypothetical protein
MDQARGFSGQFGLSEVETAWMMYQHHFFGQHFSPQEVWATPSMKEMQPMTQGVLAARVIEPALLKLLRLPSSP